MKFKPNLSLLMWDFTFNNIYYELALSLVNLRLSTHTPHTKTYILCMGVDNNLIADGTIDPTNIKFCKNRF